MNGKGSARSTAIGDVPTEDDLRTEGLGLSREDLAQLLDVDEGDWRQELPSIEEHYAQFGDHLPDALHQQLKDLTERLGR